VLENDVEIGSSTTIDRATIGETRICRGVKLDNQIQVAHNVVIGEDTVIAAQVGISGSTKIGKRCMIGGQSGLVGHITICDDVIIGAAVGVSKSINKPGVYLGYRGKPMRESLREDAMLKELPALKDRVKELENKINKKG
jgi:UDP-3-O-[3-hydroxymyristoyl] glucosamine N-acyltransferase